MLHRSARPDAQRDALLDLGVKAERIYVDHGLTGTSRERPGLREGKQPKLNRRQEAHLVSLVHSGDYSTLEIAELFRVGRSTVYRAIQRQRVAANAEVADASTRR